MKRILPYLIIVALCLFAIRALFVPGFFTMHDDEQIARLYDFNNSLLAGQIPPRWVSHLGFGFGYPLFNFYPPFVYYAGELFYLVGFSLINATKIVMALGFLLSAIFMYLWVKNRYGMLAGIFSAILYTYAPYHGVDLYVRGAFAEFFSFVWIPAVFWALDLAMKKKSYGWGILSGVFLAFLVLTHSLTALAFAPFYLGYLLVLFYENRKSIQQLLPILVVSIATSLGLSAYFFLPSLLEKNYTLVDQILTKEYAAYTLHFVCINQFWNSPWGYGGSVSGCVDGLSFQIGKLHLLLAGLSLLGIGVLFFHKKITKHLLILPTFIFALFLLSLFMATNYSQLIWSAIQPLSYIQFPWRFLVFSAAFSSFLGGFCLYVAQQYLWKRVSYLVFIIFASIPIVLIASYFKPQKTLSVTDAFYTINNDIEWRVSGLSYEYVPKGVATVIIDNTTHLAIQEKDIPKVPYHIISGNMTVTVLSNKPQDKQFAISAGTESILQINTYSFPGWEVFIDGNKTKYSDNNKLKLITIQIPKGQHTIKVYFGDTVVRTIGNIVTGMTLILILLWCLFTFFPIASLVTKQK